MTIIRESNYSISFYGVSRKKELDVSKKNNIVRELFHAMHEFWEADKMIFHASGERVVRENCLENLRRHPTPNESTRAGKKFREEFSNL